MTAYAIGAGITVATWQPQLSLPLLLDVMERDVLPMTERGVAAGNKIFGAALLRKSDMSVVIAGTNSETDNPLLHGEISTLNQFYAMPDRPSTRDLLFLSTHEPCPLCLSAITWAGFDNFYYFFTYRIPGTPSVSHTT